MNLTNFLFGEDQGLSKELASVISDIAIACKSIDHDVSRSGLLNLHGAVGFENVQGEQVQILDERTNDYMKANLTANENVVVMASEEDEHIIVCGEGGGYGVAFDPLDGSSNIDVNGSVGTIFSVLPAKEPNLETFMQSADKQAAAGYVLYGSSTVMVFTTGNGVHEFTLDLDSGEFTQTAENMQIPLDAGYISYNSYVLPKMEVKKAIAYERLLKETGRSQRYVGAMVADIHRTILKGGFFSYSSTGKDGAYKGKLRLLYEAMPIGWVVEQAGGTSLLDDMPINEVIGMSLHQRVSVEMGDAKTIERYQKNIEL